VQFERVVPYAVDALTAAPDIQRAETWSDGDRPFGPTVTFSTGARLWLALTRAAAPGASLDAEAPVTGQAPAEVPLPDLYADGKITAGRAEQYLAAVLTNAAHSEVARVHTYSGLTPAAMHPGVGIVFHSKARVHLPFVHTARAGQDRGRAPFQLQSEF
jgi:hypothetical protein